MYKVLFSRKAAGELTDQFDFSVRVTKRVLGDAVVKAKVFFGDVRDGQADVSHIILHLLVNAKLTT